MSRFLSTSAGHHPSSEIRTEDEGEYSDDDEELLHDGNAEEEEEEGIGGEDDLKESVGGLVEDATSATKKARPLRPPKPRAKLDPTRYDCPYNFDLPSKQNFLSRQILLFLLVL